MKDYEEKMELVITQRSRDSETIIKKVVEADHGDPGLGDVIAELIIPALEGLGYAESSIREYIHE